MLLHLLVGIAGAGVGFFLGTEAEKKHNTKTGKTDNAADPTTTKKKPGRPKKAKA